MTIDVRDTKNATVIEELGHPGYLMALRDLDRICGEAISLMESARLTKMGTVEASCELVALLSPESERMVAINQLLIFLHTVASNGKLRNRAERIQETKFATAAIAVAPRKTRQEMEQLRLALASVWAELKAIHDAARRNCAAAALEKLNDLRTRVPSIRSDLQDTARAIAPT